MCVKTPLFALALPLFFAAAIFCSCKDNGNANKESIGEHSDNEEIHYAEYFRIKRDTLSITNDWNGTTPAVEKYLLVHKDSRTVKCPDGFKDVIKLPIESCICMSTTHLAYLSLLGKSEIVKGLSGTRFVSGEQARKLVDAGKIKDIGSETAPDYEEIMAMKPDVAFVYGIAGSDNSYIEKLNRLGIKTIAVNDYLESTPLGKLEYLKFFGILTGTLKQADSLTKERADEYLRTRNNCAEMLKKKRLKRAKVLMNMPFKGVWYVPGENNYTSALVKDAGGEILGAVPGAKTSGQLSFEKVYALAAQADVWLNPNNLSKLSSLAADNIMYNNIPAFKRGDVYNNIKRITTGGGSDFWETGSVEPQIILKDLIEILHPQLVEKGREMKYFIKLQ